MFCVLNIIPDWPGEPRISFPFSYNVCQITKVHLLHRKTIRYNNDHSLVVLKLFPKIVLNQSSEEGTFKINHIYHGDENIEINRI